MSYQNNLHRLFLTNDNLSKGEKIKIEGEKFHYIVNVLRLTVNNKFYAFNNTPFFYLSKIIEIDKNILFIEVLDRIESQNESRTLITLLQGIPKSDKIELIIQKTTELGINKIVPIKSSHSIKKLSEEKTPRLKKIAFEASRQSKRTFTPEILNPCSLNDYFESESSQNFDLKILFDQDSQLNLKDFLKTQTYSKIIYAIGPEGDYSKDEKDLLIKKDFKKVSLGARILRTETAAIVALGIIQYESENL